MNTDRESISETDFLNGVRTFFEQGLAPGKDFSYDIVHCDPKRARIDMPYQADLATSDDNLSMHSAVLTTLIDTCLGIAALAKSKSTRPIATVDLRVDFVRSGTPGNDLRSDCVCHQIRDELAFAEGTISDKVNGDILVKAMGTFMLGTKGPDFSKLKTQLSKTD